MLEDLASLEVLEGAPDFANLLKKRFSSILVHNRFFEDFVPNHNYDVIILAHVLEHVKDPVEIFRRVGQWLTSSHSRIISAVPNSRSLHRQAAVAMGLLPFEKSMG
jgi:2-polyprenyl-3-methyl-5-hydroxy-6-metoxy-1,4-benzoquinol methylase